jgi:hypothetical protein
MDTGDAATLKRRQEPRRVERSHLWRGAGYEMSRIAYAPPAGAPSPLVMAGGRSLLPVSRS